MESRKENRSKSRKSENVSDKAPERVAFDQWFHEEVKKNPRLKEWQFKELSVFMRKQGLSEKEDREAYQRAWQKY